MGCAKAGDIDPTTMIYGKASNVEMVKEASDGQRDVLALLLTQQLTDFLQP